MLPIQVRVRAGVRVSRDPVEFEYNDFTAWEPVKGIATKGTDMHTCRYMQTC